MDRIEGDFEDQLLLDLADRAEAADRVVAHEAVEPFQLLVGEAEIGLADRQQLAAALLGPAAERVIRVIGRALAAAARGVHQHAIGDERIALPFVPEAGLAAGDVGAVAALQHHAFDRGVAGAGADLLQRLEVLRLDQRGQIEPPGIEPGREGFEPGRGAPSAASGRRSSAPSNRMS